jgi:pyruvate/2-oxoglutarate dehydrogenase complex dihydrolipoamide dehydrogenase (E3) component
MVRGEASFADPHTLIVRWEEGWRKITADNIVIAVGTQPAPPPGVIADGEIILTSDDIMRLKQVPRVMAVVGASVIGVEYASMFSALGVPVTLVEKRQRPLEFLDHEIVEELMHQMRDRMSRSAWGRRSNPSSCPTGPRDARSCTSSPANASSPTWSSSRRAGSPLPRL